MQEQLSNKDIGFYLLAIGIIMVESDSSIFDVVKEKADIISLMKEDGIEEKRAKQLIKLHKKILELMSE